jgi:hypothetical protein
MNSPRRRAGVSLLEALAATVILTLAALPLLSLFQGGVRRAAAGVDEVIAGQLLAELGEQVAAVPGEALRSATEHEPTTLDSEAGTLRDGARLGATWVLRLTSLPEGYRRKLRLTRAAPDLVHAEVTVTWRTAGGRTPSLAARRVLVLPDPHAGRTAW